MNIQVNIKLPKTKDNSYIFNLDLTPEKVEFPEVKQPPKSKTRLGAIERPSADRLKLLKHPELKAEEEDTEKIMDSLEL